MLKKATELLKFLRETLDDDFRNLIDAVEERSEQTIDESVVSDLIKVKQLLQPVLRQTFENPDKLFECLKSSMHKEGKGMASRINNCSHHVHGLKALYQHVANRGELTKEIIENVMTKGQFKWNLEKGKSVCLITIVYKLTKAKQENKKGNKDKMTTKFSWSSEELNDLRSRALLLSNNEKRDKNEDGEKAYVAKKLKIEMQNFVKAVDVAHDICTIVTELYNLGHFEYKAFTKTIQSGKDVQAELSQLQSYLQDQLENWISILELSREKYLSLNYLFSDQISLVSSYLMGKCDSTCLQQLNNLLYFLHPGSDYKDITANVEPFKTNFSIQSKLEQVGEKLDELKKTVPLLRTEFPKEKEFTKQSSDINAVVQQGVLYIAHLETNSTQTIPILLSLYFNTKGYFPVPSEVLFCHELTSWEEIQLIVQRSIKSAIFELPELFCICNVERLPSNLQYQLVEKLASLLQDNDVKYLLAVICRGGQHHPIIDHFSSYVHRVQGFDTATMKYCLQNTWNNVSMVTSSVPGLGKSEYILSSAQEKGLRLKTVHISGPLSRDILVSRLQQQKLTYKDTLHLDIAELEDPNFVDACLFEFIILGCLCSGTKVVCLSTSHVSIEVANTVQNRLRDSLVVLSCFKREHLKWKMYENFVVSEEVLSPVQIACHYMKALNDGTLDRVDIFLTGTHAVKPLHSEICRSLLAKNFSTASDLSFSVIEIFLNVFGEQLKKLSNSHYFRVKNLKAMLGEKQSVDVRSKLVKALMEVAKEFACRSVQSCRSVQNAAQIGTNELPEQATKKETSAEIMTKRVEGMLQWADTNHLLIAFNSMDSQTVSALYRELNQVPPDIKELFKSQLQRDLPDFNNLSHKDFQSILEKVSKTKKGPVQTSDETYALTPDNLLKMVLILLRIRANIPVIIMGETGCGKTSLIRYLARVCDTTFEHFSIHAGITVEMIIDVVMKKNHSCHQNPNQQIWLFLDEINTCDHMGLLTEIICHHRCFGKALANNLVFIAACNPYRLREEHQITTAGLDGKVKMDEFSRLVYRVHPLPETMIDYVWDYGTLHQSDENSYIRQMVNKLFSSAKSGWNLNKKIVSVLVASQNFVRNKEGNKWCVSLRDVYRCKMLMERFKVMLETKSKFSTSSKFHEGGTLSKSIYFASIVLALAHCYQSRLTKTEDREDYWKICSEILLDDKQKYIELKNIVRDEQMDLLKRMERPQGIAMNTALMENVFVILVCILNRIPIFLVGKPGCSKSLSVQLIKSNLRGKDSNDPYFQTLPNLYIVSYQGSESSTSEGIIKVFQKAEKYREANKHLDVLPVVLLDEVGLAEASRFNPLKVLHGLLEPATGELPNVAVVGISNWSLDAAKMNRAIHLSRPDMDAKELFETGKSISSITATDESIKKTLFKRNSILEAYTIDENTLKALADAYYKYQKEQTHENFHGLRDYYSLIKYVSRRIKDMQNEESDGTDIIQLGLLRNFGGLVHDVNEINRLFLSELGINQNVSWAVLDVIKDNFKDTMARHLMVITSGDLALGMLLQCLISLDRKPTVIIGSKFEEDQTEDYSYRILNRIILCMETGTTLVLKDLDTIYGSLYDMLNQNYTVVGKKKNCRIALGPYSNPMCQVHDDFRCIVLVDEQKVDFTDPPFLNRFEKQVLRFDDIIQEEQKQLIKELNHWIHEFCLIYNSPFKEEDSFVGINPELIASLVYQTTKIEISGSLSKNEIFQKITNALLWLVPPDAILRMTQSKFAKCKPTEVEDIQEKYFRRPVHQGLAEILQILKDDNSNIADDLPPAFTEISSLRVVVYTHSNIHADIHTILQNCGEVQVEKLGSFKSEKQLTKQIRKFFESDIEMLVLPMSTT